MNILKIYENEVFHPTFNLKAALIRAALEGYAFCPEALSPTTCTILQEEAYHLQFESGEYVSKPIREYKNTTVTQAHERAYFRIGDRQVPLATFVSTSLARQVHKLASTDDLLKELLIWAPTEAGYQRYRTTGDHISPHRDRRTDQLLGATATINGSALVRIHRPLGDRNDYSRLYVVEEFKTTPSGLMLLRAPGLASGEQVIHEVLPPTDGDRLILNLRMRPDILRSPGQEARHE